jgi:hypothetical protein
MWCHFFLEYLPFSSEKTHLRTLATLPTKRVMMNRRANKPYANRIPRSDAFHVAASGRFHVGIDCIVPQGAERGTRYVMIHVRHLKGPAAGEVLEICMIDSSFCGRVLRNGFGTSAPLSMRIDVPLKQHKTEPDVSAEALHRMMAALAVAYGLTCGGESWAVYNAADSGGAHKTTTFIPFIVPRSQFEVHHHGTDESYQPSSATKVVDFNIRGSGTTNPLRRYESTGKINCAHNAAKTSYTTCGAAASHPQCVLLRMLCAEMSSGYFRTVDVSYDWAMPATKTCAVPTNVEIHLLNAPLTLQHPTICFCVYPWNSGKK